MERRKILFFKNFFKKNENIKINKNNKINQKRKKNLYKIVNKKYEKIISILKLIFLIFLCFIYILISPKKIILIKKRIGVLNLSNSNNVGNILVKFSLFKKLKEFDFVPIMLVRRSKRKYNINFINRTVNLKIIQNKFSDLNESDYDYLIVNSDQTWNKDYNSDFYDIAFLKFAENWKINKFIYAASIGSDKWNFLRKDEIVASKLLKNFTGISFREKGLVQLAEEHLNLTIKPVFVLDPTLIIDKKYYLDEIKNYKRDFNFSIKFIYVYQLDRNSIMKRFINEASKKIKYKVIKHERNKGDFIESFLFGMNNSQAVITDSFHGTVFSIIFNKPFITFLNKARGKGRFDSLKEVFGLEKRIIDPFNFSSFTKINLLSEPLNINQTLINEFKIFSINYLKKNLGLLKN